MDSILEAIGAFFSTFTSANWVTFGASVIAAGISIWSLRLSLTNRARPHWVDHSYTGQDQGDAFWCVRMENAGQGDATDVQLWRDPGKPGKFFPQTKSQVVKTGDAVSYSIDIPRVPKPMKMKLTWRQHPFPKRQRHKWIHYSDKLPFDAGNEF